MRTPVFVHFFPEALIRGVRRAEGEGAPVLVLAPTGKSAPPLWTPRNQKSWLNS